MAVEAVNDEFEEQLRQEALEKESQEHLSSGDSEYTVGGKLFRRDPDGTVYEFDDVKRAWFPKIDEDFLARYQMSYGTDADPSAIDASSFASSYWSNPPADINSEEYRNWYNQYCSYFYPEHYIAQQQQQQQDLLKELAETGDVADSDIDDDALNAAARERDPARDAANARGKHDEKDENGKKKKKKKNTDLLTKHKPAEPPAWFQLEDEKNTTVYVSGLPDDITEEEFKEFMTKVGVIAFDPVTRKPKMKLYTDAEGSYKGDGRCCFIKAESVDLALQILDGSSIRGFTVSVEKAQFELKGEYDPSKKRRKLTKQEKKKWQEKQAKILGWQPEKLPEGRPKCERVVVIRQAFLPQQFEQDPSLINEISADFRDECKKYGDVKKVVVCDRHSDGIVMVTFQTPEEADACIRAIHRRWFAGRQLLASAWDGRTRYQVQETAEEAEKRLQQWHTFIEGAATSSATAASETDEKQTSSSELAGESSSSSSLQIANTNAAAQADNSDVQSGAVCSNDEEKLSSGDRALSKEGDGVAEDS